MTSIQLANPISMAITLPSPSRQGLIDGLYDHFSRPESTIGVKKHEFQDDQILYMWPKADPERWFVAYTTTGAANANGLTARMGYGKDPTNDPDTETPASFYDANTSAALAQHVTGVAHTNFLVHEYGDAVTIMELHSGDTYFTKLYHFGQTWTPLFANAPASVFRGLAIHGGTGTINPIITATHAFLSSTTSLTSQLATRALIPGGLWAPPSASKLISTSSTTHTITGYPPAVGSFLSPYIYGAGGTVTSTPEFGVSKYMGIHTSARVPGTRLIDDINEVAYMAAHDSSSSTGFHFRCQYGVTGLLT
jgi:hypothetical protein